MAVGRGLQTAVKAIVAAQSDSVDLTLPPDAVSIAVGGTFKFDIAGTTVATSVPAGTLWISGITRIWTTGTAATGILCLYFTA